MIIVSPLTDEHLRVAVEEQLRADPMVPETNVGVSVTDGTVVLSGIVHSSFQRLSAVNAARRANAARTLIDNIVVRPATSGNGTHGDLCAAVQCALQAVVPAGVTATMRDDTVTLAGSVDRQEDKESVERAIRAIDGVSTVHNHIAVRATVPVDLVHRHITAALHLAADSDAAGVQVATDGDRVWLTGKVRSIDARELAERAALATPGVVEVHNNIVTVA